MIFCGYICFILTIVFFASAFCKTQQIKITNDELKKNEIELGRWYRYKNEDGRYNIFVPLEIDSMGLRYFMSFDNLCSGNTFHTTNVYKFKDKIKEITYNDVFENAKTSS